MSADEGEVAMWSTKSEMGIVIFTPHCIDDVWGHASEPIRRIVSRASIFAISAQLPGSKMGSSIPFLLVGME